MMRRGRARERSALLALHGVEPLAVVLGALARLGLARLAVLVPAVVGPAVRAPLCGGGRESGVSTRARAGRAARGRIAGNRACPRGDARLCSLRSSARCSLWSSLRSQLAAGVFGGAERGGERGFWVCRNLFCACIQGRSVVSRSAHAVKRSIRSRTVLCRRVWEGCGGLGG